MKGVIIVPSTETTDWVPKAMPGISPMELPIAGKRYIDYAIEYAEKKGYEMVEVLDWCFSERLAAEFEDLAGSSIPVFYQKGVGERPRTVDDLARQSSPLTQDLGENITVSWGLELANLHIRSITDWYRANMAILYMAEKNGSLLTLPGYSDEGGIYRGSNVVIEQGCELKRPVLLQDNVWCAKNTLLDGFCIVGRESFISESVRLKRAVIGDDTFIGFGLDLVDKMVFGKRVIDVRTETWVDIDEPGVVRKLHHEF
ncbi:MAG: hypothetical protein IJJ33_13040 [Victivallales bacterium]|nr:hypothetical protein [Victivallales bacterium]